jgi:hypothetical protein
MRTENENGKCAMKMKMSSSPRWPVPRGGVFKMGNENGKCEMEMKMSSSDHRV